MGIFGKSKKNLLAEIARTGGLLTDALNSLQTERTQHGHTKAELQAREIELETARRERDGYEADALKHRAARANLRQYRKPAKAANGEARA